MPKSITTTLNEIRQHGPCESGWKTLLRHLGKTVADDEPLTLETILDSNGLDDALWCLRVCPQHDNLWRLYAIWCARQVDHLMQDERSLTVLTVAERYARGTATDDELAAARDASAAAWDAAWDASAAASAAAWDASAAASVAASAAARAAARDASAAARTAARTASAAASAAAWDASAAARTAARTAAWAAQTAILRRVFRGEEVFAETMDGAAL